MADVLAIQDDTAVILHLKNGMTEKIHEGIFILQAHILLQCFISTCPVHGTGIEMHIAKLLCKKRSDRTLSGSARAVDCDIDLLHPMIPLACSTQ